MNRTAPAMRSRSDWRWVPRSRSAQADAPALALAPGDPLAAAPDAAGLAAGLADGSGCLEVGQLLGLDLDELGAGLDRGRLEALLGEDGLDLVGRHVRVLEADLPAGPARVVDRELESRIRDRGQQDEDQARDGEEE